MIVKYGVVVFKEIICSIQHRMTALSKLLTFELLGKNQFGKTRTTIVKELLLSPLFHRMYKVVHCSSLVGTKANSVYGITETLQKLLGKRHLAKT
jgi:hypothetical protein